MLSRVPRTAAPYGQSEARDLGDEVALGIGVGLARLEAVRGEARGERALQRLVAPRSLVEVAGPLPAGG
jgi:hypothetical protein